MIENVKANSINNNNNDTNTSNVILPSKMHKDVRNDPEVA